LLDRWAAAGPLIRLPATALLFERERRQVGALRDRANTYFEMAADDDPETGALAPSYR
jgi:hypothetical protein